MLAELPNYRRDAWEKAIPGRCLITRDDTILELARGRHVLHLGAADSPFTRAGAAEGKLLHQKLRSVAASLVGIDQDADAVAWLRDAEGIDDILVGDARNGDALAGQRFDVVLCCDIIEHVSNPGELLDAIKFFLNEAGILVVTTVNATALKSALRALVGREAVHPDHICYFSFATLCELLLRHGLRPRRFGTFNYPARLRAAARVFGGVTSLAPGSADGLLMIAGRDGV